MINTEKINVLLIEDEEYDIRRIQNTLKPFSDRIEIKDVVSDGHSALDLLHQDQKYDVVIMDFQISGGLKGENLIRKIKTIDITIQVIVITKMTLNVTDFDFASGLLEAGAIWYCTKYPGDIEEYIYQPTDFVLSIYNAFEKRKLQIDKLRTNGKLERNIREVLEKKQIIGDSQAMQQVREEIQRCAKTNANVVILGASGTGKELVATNVHYLSGRSLENFIPINCGSLPDHLIESELFGFEKGAFTGADSRKKGLFEVADKGTIFLDEIAELPLSAQSKLLRVIQEGEIDKIGRTGKIKVDVRLIAASNKDLYQEVKEKRFREDLYYRLNVARIQLAPLRERQRDIPTLVRHFADSYCKDMKRSMPFFEEKAMEVFTNFEWPGNVRQLQNAVQRLLFTGENTITPDVAKVALGFSEQAPKTDEFFSLLWDKDEIRPWQEVQQIFRERYFRFVREHTTSDAEAARLLGLAPPNYHRMSKQLGLK